MYFKKRKVLVIFNFTEIEMFTIRYIFFVRSIDRIPKAISLTLSGIYIIKVCINYEDFSLLTHWRVYVSCIFGGRGGQFFIVLDPDWLRKTINQRFDRPRCYWSKLRVVPNRFSRPPSPRAQIHKLATVQCVRKKVYKIS